MVAVSDIAEASGAAFRIIDDVDFDLLLVLAERGAIALHRVAAAATSTSTAAPAPTAPYNADVGQLKRDVHLCAAALKIIYHNLAMLARDIGDKDAAGAVAVSGLLSLECRAPPANMLASADSELAAVLLPPSPPVRAASPRSGSPREGGSSGGASAAAAAAAAAAGPAPRYCTYRERIRRLLDLIVGNPRVNPDISPVGANAVMFAGLRDILIPQVR